MFDVGDILRDTKTGKHYLIYDIEPDFAEKGGYYFYIRLEDNFTSWIRSQTVDKYFVKVA